MTARTAGRTHISRSYGNEQPSVAIRVAGQRDSVTGQRDTPVTLLGGVYFWLDYVHTSSDSNSFANRLSSLSYVDPCSFRSPRRLETTLSRDLGPERYMSVTSALRSVGRLVKVFEVLK